MKRIYADFNDVYNDGTLPLICAGSVTSIEELPERLREGEEVELCDDELIVLATVHRWEDGSWVARSDWKFSRLDPPGTGGA